MSHVSRGATAAFLLLLMAVTLDVDPSGPIDQAVGQLRRLLAG